ncbi:MAG: DUF4347 domain-containing protein, partial [Candidatus Contendobacter sp.]|nr:DUF4347 domain-containing protein [Candidatus Contendobacter sp.]
MSQSVVFIDSSLPDYQSLVAAIAPGTETILIQAGESGLMRMADWAAGHQGYDSIAIVGHGSDGVQQLGTDRLDAATLGDGAKQSLLKQVGTSLTPDGDLLLYGCDVALGETGQKFVQQLAQLTGADVAASTDITGKSGNWQLEYNYGFIGNNRIFNADQVNMWNFNLPGITSISKNNSNNITYAVTPNADGSINLTTGGTVLYSNDGNSSTTSQLEIKVTILATYTYSTGSKSNLYFVHNFYTNSYQATDSPWSVAATETLKFYLNPGWATYYPNVSGTLTIDTVRAECTASGLQYYEMLGAPFLPVSFNATPSFVGGTTQTLSYNTTTTATQDLVTYLHTSDSDASQTETWTQQTAPTHGTISISGATASSGSTDITPGGTITYTPSGGYSGSDTFTIRVSDGTATADKTFTVFYNDPPSLNVGTTTAYTEQTPVAVASGITIGETADSEWNGGTLAVQISTNAEATDKLYLPASNPGGSAIWLDSNGNKLMAGATQIGTASAGQVTSNTTWIFTFNASATSALVQDAARAILFDDNTDAPSTTSRTVTFTATDAHNYAGTSTATSTQTISLTAVNDAPSFTGAATLSAVSEDTAGPAGAAVSSLFSGKFFDPDAGASLGGMVIVGDASAGSQGAWEYSTDSGSNWFAVGSVSASSGLVLSSTSLVRFKPAADWNGTPGSLSVHAADNSQSSFTAGAAKVIFDTTNDSASSPVSSAAVILGTSVTPVNDAPVLIDGVPLLTTRTENNTTNAGNLISDLLAGTTGGANAGDKTGITDVDTLNNGGAGNTPEAVGQGVAIYSTTNSGPADGGTWEYSTNGGGSWTAIGTVSSSSALLLAATDKVRFVPDAQNAATATISYCLWDGATGTHGNKVDPGARGGSTAFSLGSDTATLTVTAVNDAPTLDLDANNSSTAGGNNYKTIFLPRGSEVAIVDSDITIADVDKNDRTDVAQRDKISQAVVTLDASTAVDNLFGTTYETLSFKVGGVATASWNGLTIAGNGTATVTISGAADWATYQSALQKVLYNNSNTNASTGDRTVTVTITDNDDTDVAAAHTNKLTATASTTIVVPWASVLDMNGSVDGANYAATYTEGQTGTYVAASNASITNQGGTAIKTVTLTLSNPLDGVAGADEKLFVSASMVTFLTGRGITVSGNNTHALTLSASNLGTGVPASDMQIGLRGVQYFNDSQAPSVTLRVIDVAVTDLNMVGVPAQTTVTLIPVNDAPVISGGAVAAAVLEGGRVALGTANLNATDVDDDQASLDFVVTTAPTKGVLFRDGNGNGIADSGEVLAATTATGVITRFTQGDLAGGLIKYQQTDSAAGSVTAYGADSVAFKVEDGLENGVIAPSGTLTINITPVNDAPTLTANTGTRAFSEVPGTAVVLFSGSAISAIETGQLITEVKLTVSGLADGAAEKLVVDGGTAFALQTAATTGVAGGTLTGVSYAVAISGTTATVTLTHAGMTAAQAQALVNGIAYQNSSTAPTTTDRVVTLISVKDNGTTANGGVDTTTLSIASTITITATDTAPVIATNAGASLSNGALKVLLTGELNTTDSDTTDSALIYTVGTATTKGTLFKDSNASGAVEAGETLTAGSTFTQAELAAGLIKYRHSAADNSSDSFTFTVKDATTTLASATFNLTINGSAPTTPTVTCGGSTTANSTDGSDVLFNGVVITPAAGNTVKSIGFTVSGVQNGSNEIVTINGQAVAMNAGTTSVGDITYTVVNNGGGSFTVTVTDTTNTGWNSADASAMVNSARYKNVQVPPGAGVRTATLDAVTDWTAGGGTVGPTPVSITSTITLVTSTDLWTLPQAQTAVPAPSGGNDKIQKLNFSVTGASDGANEVMKINGHEISMGAGSTTVDGTVYTVTAGGTAGTYSVSVTNAGCWTEAEAEALLDGATYVNNQNPATMGSRVVTLVSVVEANSSVPLAPGGNPTPSLTPTLGVSPGNTATVSTAGGPITYPTPPQADTPLSGSNLTVTAGSSVDALTFTVAGVKDGSQETLTVDGIVIPLVSTTAGALVTGTSGVKFTVTVTVDAAGKATVLIDTPDAPSADAINYTEAQARVVVKGAVYTNNATTPTDGPRVVELTKVKEETGTGSPAAGTSSDHTPTPSITGTKTVTGAPSSDPFNLPANKLPDLDGDSNPNVGDTVDSITVGVSGVKDGANEIININGQAISLVAGVTTDAKGYTYTVTIDANGNATIVLGTPTPVSNFTEAEANTIIDGISYTDKANPPTSGARDISVNGIVKETPGTPTVLTPVPTPGINASVAMGTVTNTGPTISANTTVAVAEGQSVTLTSSHVAATDAQQAAGSLVFKLVTVPEHGSLFRDSNGNGLVDAGETIALNGTFTQLELTSGSIKYRHDSSETASDVLSFTVSDGIATTTAMSLVFAVSRVNDQPTLTATVSTPTFTEALPTVPVALFSAVTASTGDTLGAAQKLISITLTVSNVRDGASEMLLVNGANTIELSGVTASGTAGSVNGSNVSYTVSKSGALATITLSHAGLTEVQFKALLEGLKYNNTSANPTSGARSVSITQIKDDGGAALPNLDTATLTLTSTVTVAASNDAPTLSGTGFTVVEGAGFTLSTTQLNATDVDTPMASMLYKVTTAPSAGTLYIDVDGNGVNNAGDTTLTLNSTFTQAQLTSGNVRYQHDGSENADPLLAFSVSDGNSSSAAQTVAVVRTPVNDAPTLAGLDGDVLTYPPANVAMLIDVGGNATVTDPDSSDFNTGTLRASVYFNGDVTKDVLSIKNVGTGAGQISVAGSAVSYAGTQIGTVAGGSSGVDLVVTLNASATPTATQALISALQFYNSDTAPANNSRGIRITLSDGDGGTSLASQVQVNIPVGGPSFLSGSGFYVSENTSLVTVMAASDAIGKLPIVFSISPTISANNVDAAKFSIDTSNGTLSFLNAPDYEVPTDSGGNNVYNVVVRARNNEGAYTESALAVNVVNIVNESSGAAPGDTAGPVFGFATVNGTSLVMTYSDASALDATNIPAANAFAVSGNTVNS